MTRKRYDPTDPEQVAVRQEVETLRNEQRKADWKWMLDDPRGKRIMVDLLRQFRLFAPSYVPGDTMAMAFNEGMRASSAVLTNTILTIGSQEAVCDILKGLTDPNG